MDRPAHPTRLASWVVYLGLLFFALVEQWGRITNDTRIAIIEAPIEAMRSTFSLWNPMVSLGELQNQAYGYLWPMGPFFALGELASVPPWVTERLWSVLLIVVGAEGARLLARSMGLGAWPAWFAGMAYGLNARVIGQLATRSAEVLPGVVLPWVLLPLVLAMQGRIRPRTAALLSVGAATFMGAVNGTATVAPLPLVMIFLVWGVVTGRARWSLVGWWSGLLAVASLWWIASLAKLSAYSPPFFDFVEDAKVTTLTTGWFPSLRAADNWVAYLNVVDRPNWPAGHMLAYQPVLVAITTAVATLGLVGLVRMRSPWRQPLLVSAVLGAVLLTIAHTSSWQSPLAPLLQDLLDGPLAMLRNVHKIDPVFRLPLAIGLGAAVAELLALRERGPQWRRRGAGFSVGVAGVLVLAVAQPAVAMNLRTPGWKEVPEHWTQAADYLADRPGNNRSWVIPGVGFGVQTWGWTLDEPMSFVARTPWVTRSQVPLTPPETIRVLSRMEDLLDTGTGSPYLGEMLARLGLGYVVLRHDLEPSLSEGTSSALVSIAMARSGGVTRVAQFGRLTFGPAVEIYRVTRTPAPEVSVRPLRDVVTVAGGPADVLDAVAQALVAADRPAVVARDSGWKEPADVAGDAVRLRERNFGRVHDSEGPVLSEDEPRQGVRVVPNYPIIPESQPVRARYTGVTQVTASSSQASVGALGAVRPETAPFSAVDGDPASAWLTATYHRPDREWLEVRLDEPARLGPVTVDQPVDDVTVDRVVRWRLEAGGRSDEAEADPFTGRAVLDLGGVEASTVRLTAVRTANPDALTSIGVSELDLGDDVRIERTLVVPEEDLEPGASYLFSARPETRACVATLLGPDCQVARRRVSDESTGIDRVVTVPEAGVHRLRGKVVARSGLAATSLLDPFGGEVVVRASSTYAGDPQVSARMLYDGAGNTSWIADPRDGTPDVVIDWDRPRWVGRIAVSAPARPGVAPTSAVIRADGVTRVVKLDEFGFFDPVRARRLEIVLRNPTRDGEPIGVSELLLTPGRVTRPLDGATRTGAVCGFGPQVQVGDRTYQTRVSGVMGDVSSAGQLDLLLCGRGIRLPAGETRIRIASTNQFQPVAVTVEGTRPDPARGEARTLRQVSDTSNRQVYDLEGGEASLLSTTRNFNPGWRATLDGRVLEVQRADGWAQGWRIPEGDGGRLVIDYAPQRSYVIGLVGGLVLAALVLLAALVALVRLRLAPEGTYSVAARPGHPPHHPPHHLRRTRWQRYVRGELVVVLAWVVAGIPGAVGLVAAWLARRLRIPVAPVAVLLIAAAAVVAIVDGRDGPALSTEPANLLAGIGVAMLIGSAWRTPFASPRTAPGGRSA